MAGALQRKVDPFLLRLGNLNLNFIVITQARSIIYSNYFFLLNYNSISGDVSCHLLYSSSQVASWGGKECELRGGGRVRCVCLGICEGSCINRTWEVGSSGRATTFFAKNLQLPTQKITNAKKITYSLRE